MLIFDRIGSLAAMVVCVIAGLAAADDATLSMTRAGTQTLDTWHFHAGVPFAKGALRDASQFALYRDGKPVPAQARTVATWGPEGSIKWLAVDFVDGVTANQQNQYTFRTDATTTSQRVLRVNETADHIQVNNGRLNLHINKAAKGFNLFDSVTLDGRNVWSSANDTGPYIVDGEGVIYRAALDATAEVRVESVGLSRPSFALRVGL